MFTVLLGLSWYVGVSEAVKRPGKVKEHLQKAAELEEKEIYVDAVLEYEKALEYKPDDTAISVRMAKAYLNSGNTSKFTDICGKAAKADPDNTEAVNLLMEYYLDNNYENKAIKYVQGYLELYPDNENAQQWLIKLKGSYKELYCRYDEMSEIINGCMVVQSEDLYGSIDARGQEILECKYEELYPFSEEGIALARNQEGAYSYIDEEGRNRKVPDAAYENLGMFSEERAVAGKDGSYGYLDEEMEPVGKFAWEELTGIKNSIGAGKKDKKWRLVNKKGEAKGKKEYDGIVLDEAGFCSNQKRIFVKEGERYRLVDQKGKEASKLSFDNARAFTPDGYAAVCKDGKWGFLDADGKLAIDYLYDDAQSFQNGLAAVCKDNLWGYIDIEGNLVIEPRFVEATHFSAEGTAAVKVEENEAEEWRLIQLEAFM